MSKLEKFLTEHFNGLILRPPLFYRWGYGIRFEISHPELEFEDKLNLTQVNKRSKDIFNAVFKESDEILLITNVYRQKNDTYLYKKPMNLYKKYVKNRQALIKLEHKVLPNPFEDDGLDAVVENLVTHCFVLPCKKHDIRYVQLLTAICYENFPHPSQILKRFPREGYDIFFVNLTQRIIYHFYDDRGCDVIAADKEDIRFLYHEFNEWILDYDRDKIDRLFT